MSSNLKTRSCRQCQSPVVFNVENRLRQLLVIRDLLVVLDWQRRDAQNSDYENEETPGRFRGRRICAYALFC